MTIQIMKNPYEIPAFSAEQSILLIEDNSNMRAVMEEILSLFGYNLQSAGTGEEGLKLFEEDHLILYFLDIGLPDYKWKRHSKNNKTKKT
jgi:CheY-like chemotaxis protein